MDHTIQISRPTIAAGLLRAIAAPFEAVGSFLIGIGERSPEMIALNRLAETSDETLLERNHPA